MIIISRKLFSENNLLDLGGELNTLSRENRRARRKSGRIADDINIENDLEKLKELRKQAKKDRRRLEGNKETYDAYLDRLDDEEHNIKYQNRLDQRQLKRSIEQRDINQARAIEDEAGTGNDFKRKVQDLKLDAKYKLQDLSDSYYGKTGGRSLLGDSVLGAAAIGGGYLAYKTLKKAKYEKEQAKKKAEEKFNIDKK